MKTGLRFFVFCYVVLDLLTGVAQSQSQQKNGNVKITFINCMGNQTMSLDSTYTNCWNESFSISQLKYYISNIALQTSNHTVTGEQNSYHLVNEADDFSKNFSFYLSPDTYTSISFLIGVDSLKNVSGAQTDALDPLNGMFWTWNTGYIMFKMEGNSPQSSAVNNKIEYHIGGFAGGYNTVKKMAINFPGGPVSLNKNKTIEIVIRTNLNKLWNAINKLKITQTPVCTTPGVLAAQIASNYAQVFEIVKIVQQ
jgi:hypothetical protein